MRIQRWLPLLLLAVSCETATLVGTTGSSAEGTTDDFNVSIVQANAAMVMRNQSTADIRFNITIANRTQEPYTIKRITLQSMSGTDFVIPVRSRGFDKTIAAGAKAELPFWATAQVADIGTPRQPVTLRTIVNAVSEKGGERSETFTARINGRVQVQVANHTAK
jgi:hypothetical protein